MHRDMDSPSRPPFWSPLQDSPSEDLISALITLLPTTKLTERAEEETHDFLTSALQHVLQHPALHWWCNPQLRPISMEMLTLFGFEENESLKGYKSSLENVLGGCLDCTEAYQQDRRIFINRLRDEFGAEITDAFYEAILQWDCNRLIWRMEHLSTAEASSEVQKRKKICMCDMMLDPTALLDHRFSGTFSGHLTAFLLDLFQAKKVKIQSVLPGIWLMLLHENTTIQDWALYTSKLGASMETISTDRWTGWEPFKVVWKLALDLVDGGRPGLDSAIPFILDPARIWMGIRSMLSSMDAQVMQDAVKHDSETWNTFRGRLTTAIQDPTTPPTVVLETSRILFYLLGSLKQIFWVKDDSSLPSVCEAKRVLRTIFIRPEIAASSNGGAQKESSARTSTFVEHVSWVSSFINSLPSTISLSGRLIIATEVLLDCLSGLMKDRIAGRSTADDDDLQCSRLDYDFKLLKLAFDLLRQQESHEHKISASMVLSPHWDWIGPICALGPSAILPITLPETVEQQVIAVSNAAQQFVLEVLKDIVETMWTNYDIVIKSVKAVSVGVLERTNAELWLRLVQALPSKTISELQAMAGSDQARLQEWETLLIEASSQLALLPKAETRPHFSKDALELCGRFNDDLGFFFQSNSILLRALSYHGVQWNERLLDHGGKRFLTKLLKLWCSPNQETSVQALFIMRSGWAEVTRSSCLRRAFQVGGDSSIEELDSILSDFRNRKTPGGATPPALFQFLLDSVTTLFLTNSVDGEGGLYLQIFLELTSSQEIARHLQMIKQLWNSIWQSMKAAFLAGRTIWNDRQDRNETVKTMKVVVDVGLLIIGKIRYFERLLKFENQDVDFDAPDLDQQDFIGSSQGHAAATETMPLEFMKASLARMTDWIYAQDTMLCTAALNLVCAVLDLLAEHDDMIDELDTKALTALAAGNQEPKSLLTDEQREHLWIALSRHSAYSTVSRPDPTTAVVPETIEISDDDFGDIDEVDLTGFDFDEVEEPVETQPQRPIPDAPKAAPFVYRPPIHNPYLQTKLNFNQVDPSRPGIPAGGTVARRLPSSLTKMSISSKSSVRVSPVKKGSKLSQMRADHTRERRSIVEASKERQMLKPTPIVRAPIIQRPQSDSESPSEGESEDDNNGLNSLIDTEESWNDRNKPKAPRKTKLLELKDIAPRGTVMDPGAYRRQKAKDDYERIQRLTPNLTNLHTQILKWEVSATGDRPPDSQDYQKVPSGFDSVEAYAKAFEPLLVLECWQQLMAAREECNQSSDSIMVQIVNRVSTSHFQDTHARVPKDKASGIMVDDIVVMADPSVRDVFTEKGNATRAKPFFAKVQSIVRSKGECEVVFRTCLRIEESSALMFVRPLTRWSVLKLMNLTTTHREYAALIAMRHYDLCEDILKPPTSQPPKPTEETLGKLMGTYNVNTPQAMAIAGALAKPNGFTLIQGPPGTGKTKTILGLVGAFLDDGSRRQQAPSVQSLKGERSLQTGTVSRILVCAPSNAAIDEIVKRLKGGIRNTQGVMVSPKVVRIGTMETVNAEVKDVALEALIAKELESKSDATVDHKSHHERMAGLREKMKQVSVDLDHARLELVQVKQGNDMMVISEAQAKIKMLNTSKWKLGQELDQARSSFDEVNQKKDQARKDARDKILTEADVICSTLSASGHDLLTSSNFTFDTVIIDEAAQSVEISSLIPLKYGTKRCVLVGDPNQLPPTVMSQLATKFEYNRSLFVRIQGLAPASVHLLSIQYRMHPHISVFPSRAFYKSLLKDGPNMADKTRAEWHVNKITPPYLFFDVRLGREKVGLSHSQHNPVEAETAVELLDFLCRGNKSLNFFRRVGVISPYKQQIRTLKEYFSRHFGQKILEAVDFNTVDGFQGQEKDIIIFSCVRASNSGSVGFLSDVRRMNVALTRARQSLFILGHAETLRREPIWGDLVRDAEERGHYTMIVPDIFGPKYSQLPQNILQPKVESVDRRNDLYGRVADHRKAATVIEQPEAIMEDIIEATSYPSLPVVDEPIPVSRPSSRGSRVPTPRNARDREPLKTEDMDVDRSPRKARNTELQDRVGAKDDKSPTVDRPPLDQMSSNHGHKRKNSSPERPSADKQPPLRKPAPSLFLKSRPMSMKNRPNSSASTVPVRERLAATVAPIRKSYPSGDGHARPPPPPRRDTGPSLDQLLNTLKKPKS